MKTLINQSILLEVSQRELEKIAIACRQTAQFWHERSDSTLEVDQEMKDLRLEIGDEYERIACEAFEILNNLPF